MSQIPAFFSRITNEFGPVGKSFRLVDGRLESTSLAAVSSGKVETVHAASLSEFLEIRASCTTSQFLVYGVCCHDRAVLRVAKHTEVAAGKAIARTKKFFRYPDGPGILCIDHDAAKAGRIYEDWRELDAIFAKVLPEWAEAERQWLPSSSAMIRRADTGEVLKGAGSWRAYALIDYAPRIPDLTASLFAGLCEAGHGRTEILENGRILVRTLIDPSMREPWRPDFIKTNYSGRPEGERWLEFREFDVGNGERRPALTWRDLVAANEFFDPFAWEHKERFLEIVREGHNGEPWRVARNAARNSRLDVAVARVFELSETEASYYIEKFELCRLIERTKYKNQHRNTFLIWRCTGVEDREECTEQY